MSKAILRFLSIESVLLTLALVGCDPKSSDSARDQTRILEPPAEGAPAGKLKIRTVYVPAYSHLPQDKKPHKSLLSILLSVRNVDSTAVITLIHVDYFDTSGHRVRRYLDGPRRLRPLETAEFIVDTFDDVGGSGANFLVFWEGPSDAHPLLTESVMWGHIGPGYVSFTSRGVELERRPNPKAFMTDTSTSTPDPPKDDAASGGQ